TLARSGCPGSNPDRRAVLNSGSYRLSARLFTHLSSPRRSALYEPAALGLPGFPAIKALGLPQADSRNTSRTALRPCAAVDLGRWRKAMRHACLASSPKRQLA